MSPGTRPSAARVTTCVPSTLVSMAAKGCVSSNLPHLPTALVADPPRLNSSSPGPRDEEPPALELLPEPLQIEADPRPLQQVLSFHLTGAARYAPDLGAARPTSARSRRAPRSPRAHPDPVPLLRRRAGKQTSSWPGYESSEVGRGGD